MAGNVNNNTPMTNAAVKLASNSANVYNSGIKNAQEQYQKDTHIHVFGFTLCPKPWGGAAAQQNYQNSVQAMQSYQQAVQNALNTMARIQEELATGQPGGGGSSS